MEGVRSRAFPAAGALLPYCITRNRLTDYCDWAALGNVLVEGVRFRAFPAAGALPNNPGPQGSKTVIDAIKFNAGKMIQTFLLGLLVM